MITVDLPDPAWLVAVQHRRAVLWLGPGIHDVLSGGEAESILEELVLHPWAAVVVDAPRIRLGALVARHEFWGSLVLRLYEDDPGPDRIAPNRLPIYSLRGSRGQAGPGDAQDPVAFLNRLTMLKRVPVQHEVVVVGLGGSEGLRGLREAQSVSAAFGRLILVSPDLPSVAEITEGADALFHWTADLTALREFLRSAGAPGESAVQVLARTRDGVQVVDLAGAIDPSYPITSAFEFVPAAAALTKPSTSIDDLRTFLSDPAASWAPYAAGIPAPRTDEYDRSLARLLEQFAKEGAGASATTWLPAEEGSGATTMLRQLALSVAQRGYPVMIARREVSKFDHVQLSAFLTRASERLAHERVVVPELPWVIMFDAEHALLHSDFVTGVASALRKLLKPVVVVAVRPPSRGAPEARFVAQGTNRTLGPALTNTVTSEMAIAVGRHLSTFLPVEMRRSSDEWIRFANDAVRTSLESRSSLFWVALRFWLFRLPGAGESLRAWLSSKFEALTSESAELRAGSLEIAAMSRYRLAMPAEWLLPESYRAVRLLAYETANPLGLRRVSQNNIDSFAFAHPLLAEELLRIASTSAAALAAVEKATCLNLLDLELHLLGRIVRRPAAGASDTVDVIEDLVTTGLRVDPREAPRNFLVRDRIVSLLEDAPDSVWDASQVFNHHVAKARRHLAVEPPDRDWTLEARIEQLELAENHLLDALQFITPVDPERREPPLNLRVSLALTYVARERLEVERGDDAGAADYRRRADESYAMAQRLDADNPYVLENFARFKISQSRIAESDEERIRLLVEAVSLLQWERETVESGAREEPILVELARAYEMLQAQSGTALLDRLAREGSESAAVALAQLALMDSGEGDRRTPDLGEAERLLSVVDVSVATWRSQFALYRVVSKLRPFDFNERLELLRRLDADPEFAWPLQVLVEYGILLFQVGDPADRRRGKEVFRTVRDQLSERSGTVRVPPELRFLANPAKQFRERLLTSMVVKDVSHVGRNFYAVPRGWFNIEVPFRPYLFGDDLRERDERDCYIQFTNFGPQAVPPTTE